MREKIEPFVDDEETRTRQEKLHEPVSDEEDDGHDRWYLLLLYLEKDSHGRLKEPYKIEDSNLKQGYFFNEANI